MRRPRFFAVWLYGIIAAFSALGPALLHAEAVMEDVYLSEDSFIAQAFPDESPQQGYLWIKGDLRQKTTEILGHKPRRIRERYWLEDDRSVWILEEIGKEQPITVGITIEHDQIVDLRILIYRESRGWEVKHDFFTRQFAEAELREPDDQDYRLDRNIDGITGATLSVRAVTRLARLALIYHAQIQDTDQSS